MNTHDKQIIQRSIEDEISTSYLRYSMSVIASRALPDARDGLKPSQRRILYTMGLLKLGPQSKHRKCAKITGDTTGDFHPHGDIVVYPTLARMAQDWVMRYPLVDGQGNFGSVDGDSPAAQRYTEARMTRSSTQLMEDIEKDTVDFVPNYDETKTEPTVFPARFPNLLANGSSGIAVGMATSIPPHNIHEIIDAVIQIIDNPNCTDDDVIDIVKGPDFPTGGIVCNRSALRDAYKTGRGRVIVRCRHTIETTPKGKEIIVVNELPFSVNKSRLIQQIAHLINDKSITGISNIIDETDRTGIRIVIELKRGESSDVIMNQLFKMSDLQITYGCNLLALDNGLPKTMTLKQMLEIWLDHRRVVLRRRTYYDLAKAETRAHILEGFTKALDVLDKVISIIRQANSKEHAAQELIDKVGLTQKQANAVLELRLYQISNLEVLKVTDEYNALLQKIIEYNEILSSDDKVNQLISEDLESLKNIYKKDRLTDMTDTDVELVDERLIPNDPALVMITNDDYIKRVLPENFKEQHRGGAGVVGMVMKDQKDAFKVIEPAKSHDHLIIFTNYGRCYWTKVWHLPDTGRRSKGKPIVRVLDSIKEGEEVKAVLTVSDFEKQAHVLMCTKNGIVKKSTLSVYSNPRKTGVQAINIDEGDELISASIVYEENEVMIFTHKGMAVRFNETDVRSMGRVSRGVKGVRLKDNTDYVVGCDIVQSDDQQVLVVTENGYGKRTCTTDFRKTSRGAGGVRSIITSERNGSVVSAILVRESDSMIVVTEKGQVVRSPIRQVRTMGRSTQGVTLMSLKVGDKVKAVQNIPEELIRDIENDNED